MCLEGGLKRHVSAPMAKKNQNNNNNKNKNKNKISSPPPMTMGGGSGQMMESPSPIPHDDSDGSSSGDEDIIVVVLDEPNKEEQDTNNNHNNNNNNNTKPLLISPTAAATPTFVSPLVSPTTSQKGTTLKTKTTKKPPLQQQPQKKPNSKDRCLALNVFTLNDPQQSIGDDNMARDTRTFVYQQLSQMQALTNESLCQIVELKWMGNDRFVLVSEHYQRTLLTIWRPLEDEQRRQMLYNYIHALSCLHRHGLQHRNIALDSLLVDAKGRAKLGGYELYNISQHGELVSFPIGHPFYFPPELAAAGPSASSLHSWNAKVDTWAFGCSNNATCSWSCTWYME